MRCLTGDPQEGGAVSDSDAHAILLYDGVCGLCNRLVQFVLRRDPAGIFRFASLQGALAGKILKRHGLDSRDLDTVYVVTDPDGADEQVWARSDAVIYILRHLGGSDLSSGGPGLRAGTAHAIWRAGGFLLGRLPRTFRDWGYGAVARYRYRVFGRYETCPLPNEETRGRFLDQ